MVAQLTKTERQYSLVVLVLLALVGLAMAAAGRGDPLGAHGLIVLALSAAVAFVVLAGFYAPEPGPERLER